MELIDAEEKSPRPNTHAAKCKARMIVWLRKDLTIVAYVQVFKI